MAFTTFTNGTTANATEVNANFNESLNISGKNLVRQLVTSSQLFSSSGDDWFGEAYTDSDGRMNTVNQDNTTAYNGRSNNTMMVPVVNLASSDTVSNPNSFSNPTYAFDTSLSTYAYLQGSNIQSQYLPTLGTTFSAKTVKLVKYKFYAGGGNNIHGASITVKLQTYDGGTWNTEYTITTVSGTGTCNTGVITGGFLLNKSVSGVRLYFECNGGAPTYGAIWDVYVYMLNYGDTPSSYGEISHNIPTGTFSSTSSKAFLSPLIADWETGADIQYKIQNASEDSGWLSCGNSPLISSFTAFTSEPTTLTVKLIPKSSSPTAGYPAIYGVALRCN